MYARNAGAAMKNAASTANATTVNRMPILGVNRQGPTIGRRLMPLAWEQECQGNAIAKPIPSKTINTAETRSAL
jgi:hypothetical protein